MRGFRRDEGEFKTKRLNVWMSSVSAWLNSAQWMACADEKLDWDAFEGLDCWIGADLADKDDITALQLIAFDTNGRLICKPRFGLPAAMLDNPKHAEGRGPAPYRTWVAQGHLTLTPGDWVDHNEIEGTDRGMDRAVSGQEITFDQFARHSAWPAG
jgi:phage terminase large subunit-like protein